MMTTITGITIAPSEILPAAQASVTLLETPSLSLKDMNKLPVHRTSATQTQNPVTNQQATQYSPTVINKATDSNDLIRLAHKISMTEGSAKRDQMVHTGDLIKLNQTGTNTPPAPVAITRSTASNTITVDVKSVGVNSENLIDTHGTLLSHQGSSRIPRPNAVGQRKFMRQETFTVSDQPETTDEQVIRECPAEQMLK